MINILKKIPSSTKPIPPIPEAVWQRPTYFVAFGFGSGAIPFAPGTMGTLMAIPFYLLMSHLSFVWYLFWITLFAIGSSYLCDTISRELHTEDHPGMCLDEFVGFFVAMSQANSGLIWLIFTLILFRLFDIWKPWPIRWVDQHIHGGVGMILDDVIAGVFACLIMQFFSLFFTI